MRIRVNKLQKLAALAFTLLVAALAAAQQPAVITAPASGAAPTKQQKDVEAFLRHNFALGPDYKITVSPSKEIGTSGILEINVQLTTPDGVNNIKMFLSKDGRYLLRGELNDLSTDPLVETMAQLQTANAPVLGDPKAPITIVEFADFECPVCRNLHDVLRGLLPNYPQAKLIFKDYPIEALHPWARTAALAGRCGYQQDPKAFWKLYDLFYDNQDLISASTAWDKMLEYAGRAGLNIDAFKSCMSSPEAASAVDASFANGNLLEVHSTPTIFVNGRRIVGADPHAIQQYIDFDLTNLKSAQKK